MHRLLQRQLKRAYGSIEAAPECVTGLIAAVDAAYQQADMDRDLVARSLDIMSSELVERNAALRRQLEEQRAVQAELAESEGRFQAFMEHTPMLAALKRPFGEIVYANRQYQARFGNVVGRAIEDFLPPEAAGTMNHQDRDVLESGQAIGVEGALRNQDGEASDWLVYKFPVLPRAGGDLLIGIAALEVTERRRTQRLLERSQALLAEAHHIAKLGSWEYDVLTHTVSWTPELYRFYGAEPQAHPLTWSDIASITGPADADEWRRALTSAVETRRAFAFDRASNAPDGTRHVLHLRGHALEDEAGNLLRLVGTAQDVSERKELEERLTQMQRLEAVGQLAAGIAHEINTPVQYIGDNLRFIRESAAELMPLLGQLRALDNRDTTEPAADLGTLTRAAAVIDLDYLIEELPRSLGQAIEGTTRIAEIVRAVKAFAHPGEEAQSLADLNAVIANAMAVSRPEWKYHAEARLELAPTLPQVMCLVGEMHQMFLNLLVNAGQAIAEAREQHPESRRELGHIDVSTRCVGDHIEVCIADTGIGIPEAIRARVFDPFFTTKPIGKGTGQGLALAHRVVTTHGGKIWLESEVGRGTTFTILLPIAPEGS